MSKQSSPGDKSGWKRGAGAYSKSYPKLDRQGNPDSVVDRSSLVNQDREGGFAPSYGKAGKNKGGGVY